MANAQISNSFLDGKITRLLALLLAILIGVFMVTRWSDDFMKLFSDDMAALSTSAIDNPVAPPNAALEACLTKRVGDVDQMLKDGIINDAQHEKFAARASSLCAVQNQP